jgi:FtsP/CotA-like multicopper oxidase with cupredoxin domain
MVWVLSILAVLVVLAIALGVGLGVGLRNRSHTTTTESSSTNNKSVVVADSAQFALSSYQALGGGQQRTREYNWTVSELPGAPDGVQRQMLVVNGQYPGPLIEANEGDRIIVHVTNNLQNTTAIHWHGILQNGTNYMDGTTGISALAACSFVGNPCLMVHSHQLNAAFHPVRHLLTSGLWR